MRAIVDSLAVEYIDSGEGPVVLYLHGWKSSLKTFAGLIPRIQHVRQIRLDLPGFGHSEMPKRAWTVEDYARFVQKFCDKLNVQPKVIVGHSMGGRIILKLLSHKMLSPERVVFIGAAGVAERDPSKKALFFVIAKTGGVIASLFPEALRHTLRRTLYSFLNSDYMDAGPLTETYKNIVGEDLSEDAKNVFTPSLMIWGVDDDATPLKEGERLHALIGRSELVTIPKAGHFVHETNAAEVAERISKFIL